MPTWSPSLLDWWLVQTLKNVLYIPFVNPSLKLAWITVLLLPSPIFLWDYYSSAKLECMLTHMCMHTWCWLYHFRWSSARRAPGRRRLLLKFSFLGDFLPARLRCRGYRTVVPASPPVDTAVGAEETGPAAGHISCFILKGSIRNEEKEVISGLLLLF